MDEDKKKIRCIIGLIVFAVVFFTICQNYVAVGKGLGNIVRIFAPFIIGGCLAFIINIPMRFIERKMFSEKAILQHPFLGKIKRPIAMILAFLVILLVLTVVMLIVIPQLVVALGTIAEKFPGFVKMVQSNILSLGNRYPQIYETLNTLSLDVKSILNEAIDFLKTVGMELLNNTYSAATSVVGGVVNFFIGLIFCFYALSAKDELCSQFRKILYAFVKEPVADEILRILRMASVRFNGFIAGQCTEAMIISVLFSAVFAIFRIPYAVMIGVTIGVFSLIPIVGSFIGMIIGILLTLMESPMTALWFVVIYLIAQQIETNTIYPKVVGNSVGLPSIWVLFSVIVGGNAFGFIGMICMIPISSLIYALLRDGVAMRLQKKPVAAGKLAAPPFPERIADDQPSLKDRLQKILKKKEQKDDE